MNSPFSQPLLSLPTPTQWRLHDLLKPDLIAEIEEGNDPDVLVEALAASLWLGIQNGSAMFSHEFVGGEDSGDKRVSVRFFVKPGLFNQLFNSRVGYRAHFWVSPQAGIDFNGKIIGALRDALVDMPELVHGTDRNRSGHLRDDAVIAKSFIVDSFHSDLAKIWLVNGVWREEDKILLEGGRLWPLFFYFHNRAAVSLKGAFIGEDGGAYQFKDRWLRAGRLHETGVT